MLAAYAPHAQKRAANLSTNGDLLHKTKDLNINLSTTLEQALVEALKKKQREFVKRPNPSTGRCATPDDPPYAQDKPAGVRRVNAPLPNRQRCPLTI